MAKNYETLNAIKRKFGLKNTLGTPPKSKIKIITKRITNIKLFNIIFIRKKYLFF